MQITEELDPVFSLLTSLLLHLYLPLPGLFHLMISHEVSDVYSSKNLTIMDQEVGIS